MSTQAGLLKDCFLRIENLELRLKLDPNNIALLELLDSEKRLQAKIEGAN